MRIGAGESMLTKNIFYTVIFFILSLTVISFQNCSKANNYRVDSVEKLTKLKNDSVFDSEVAIEDDSNRSGSLSPNVSSDKTEVNSGQISGDPTTQLTLPFKFICSNNKSISRNNMNLAKSNDLEIVLHSLYKNKEFCRFEEEGLKDKIIKDKKLSFDDIFAKCPAIDLNSKDYLSLQIIAKDKDNKDVNLVDHDKHIKIYKGELSFYRESVDIILDFNNPDKDPKDPAMSYDSSLCDEFSSPLVVHLPDRKKQNVPGIKLTSQKKGILFDLLGINAEPEEHAPIKISWFKNPSKNDYYFISLPNQNGEVLGIDQLFGDNTQGPDNQTTTNGYLALAKYDGTDVSGKKIISEADGLITPEDAIYEKLKVWKDKNGDGRSQPDELFSLFEKEILVIDLNYDAKFKESDKFGNETRMKSVVKMNDGTLNLMFDLWFKH